MRPALPLSSVIPMAVSLLGMTVTAGAADLRLEAELLHHGIPAEADYEVRVLVDRGQPWLRQTLELGVQRVENGRLIAPVEIDDRLLAEARSLQLEARPAGSGTDFELLAEVAASGSCALSPWTLSGNGDATEQSFLGTTNDQPLRLRVENLSVGILDFDAQGDREGVNILLGWPGNQIGANALGNVVLGGGRDTDDAFPNRVAAGAPWTTISGGVGHETLAKWATIGGGAFNRAAERATVAGGTANHALGLHAAIGGGFRHQVSGHYAAVAGGDGNLAGGWWAAVPGGLENRAQGDLSLAAGAGARADHDGSFVWSQDSDLQSPFGSTGANQVLFQAKGGLGVNTATGPVSGTVLNAELTVRTTGSPDNNVDLMLLNHDSSVSPFRGYSLASVPNGQFYITSLFDSGGSLRYDPLIGLLAGSDGTALVSINRGGSFPQAGAVLQVGNGGNDGNGAYLSSGGAWTNASSREFKTAFSAIDPERVLQALLDLPLGTWSYRDSGEARHLGPVAEEFAAAFSLGDDPRRISTVDADGVSMAAIQGLGARLEDVRLDFQRRLEQENAELRARLDALEQRLSQIEQGDR